MLVSFVVPCYNEEESLPIFYKEACHVSDILRKEYQAEAEFIFIDDGSSDGTVKELRKLRKKDDRVRFYSLLQEGTYAKYQAQRKDTRK